MEQSITNAGILTQQIYGDYTEQDHETWRMLMEKQDELDTDRIAKVYVEGLEKLRINRFKIPKISEVSDILTDVTGWSLVPVTGLLPTKHFFLMLINKEYPVTVSIRKRHETHISEQPDIFNDVVGHLPLLTNELFVKYLTKVSTLAIKYAANENAIEILERLYWHSHKMGFLNEQNQDKPYGGTLLTSSKELENLNSKKTSIHKFDINHIFENAYNASDLHPEYFSVKSFESLLESLVLIEEKLINRLAVTEHDKVIRSFSLNRNLGINFNNVIGFLNDTQFRYPSAISFIAGQPDEQFFDVEQHISKFDVYVNHRCNVTGRSKLNTINQIGQYNKTNGIINDVLVKYLRNDESIDVRERDIIVTAGAQEAFSSIVSTICNKDEDLILMEDPSFIGLSSFAKVFDYPVDGVRIDDQNGIDLEHLRFKILEAKRARKRVKLLYVIPDYQNPTGACMSVKSRLKLLEMADEYNFLIVEDSVYNSFTYLQKKNPTLKSLDKNNRVIFVGSFSKSLFPGLRIGWLVATQNLENERGESVPLINEISKVKAQLSNHTATISQAIIGGILIENDYSLQKYNEPKYQSYRKKNEVALAGLEERVGKHRNGWSNGIKWTKPQGGFFIKVTVPFEVDHNAVVESAEKFGIIFSPMRFFYLKEGGEREIRLTFSNLSLEKISEGIGKLADYFRWKILFQEN